MYHMISMPESDELYRKQPTISVLDVREAYEYRMGHIPGSQSVPLSEFPVTLEKNKPYYVICQSGGRSVMACQHLSQQGYNVTNVMGGMSCWRGEVE